MSVLFSGQGTPGSFLLNIFSGDGETSVISVDLAAAPMNIIFNGNFPQQPLNVVMYVIIDGQLDNSFSAGVTFRRSVATVTFNKTLPILTVPGDFINVSVSTLLYHGV